MTRSELAFLCAFALLLYLSAAIASLYDEYQPGIEGVIYLAHPRMGLLFLIMLCLAGPWRGRPSHWAPFAARVVPWAFGLCLAAELGLFTAHALQLHCSAWAPGQRGLFETLRYSLTCPSFSMRSYHPAFQTALFCPAVYVFARYLAQGRRPEASDSLPSPLQHGLAAWASISLLGAAPGVGFIGYVLARLVWTGRLHLPRDPYLILFGGLIVGMLSQLLLLPLALRATHSLWRLRVAPLIAFAVTLLAIALPVSRGSIRLWPLLYGTLCGVWSALAMAVQLMALRVPFSVRSRTAAQQTPGQLAVRVE